MNNIKKQWKRRVWLNPSNSPDNGYIITGVSCEGDPYVTIADCRRTISLNIYCYDTKSQKSSISKMTKLINELVHLRDHIEDS